MSGNTTTNVLLIILICILGLPILACGGCMVVGFIAAPEVAREMERTAEEMQAELDAGPSFDEIMQETAQGMSDALSAGGESPSKGVTMDQFSRVQTGMTYREVVAILGEPTQQLSQVEVAGQRSAMFSWDGEGFGANCNVTFSNGQVMAKAQFGL